MKKYAGIDIGSRTIELLLVDEQGKIMDFFQTDTGFDPITEATRILRDVSYDQIMATGYGRGLFETAFDDAQTVTEIKAHARGVVSVFPGATTILDIGGQDSKAIALNDKGRVKK